MRVMGPLPRTNILEQMRAGNPGRETVRARIDPIRGKGLMATKPQPLLP